MMFACARQRRFASPQWRGFKRLWLSDAVNQLGTSLRVAAVPLVAATALAVTPLQMGALMAAGTLAFVVIGLPAGAWVDRLPYREVLCAANLARAALLASIPVCAWVGLLSYGQLLVVAALAGAMTVFVDTASAAMVPSLVGRAGLASANARIQTTQAAGRTAGPTAAGALAQVMGAANAVWAAAVAHLAAAVLVARVRVDRDTGVRPPRRTLRYEVAEGLRFTFGDRSLLALAGCGATYNLFLNLGYAMHVLFLVRELGLSMASAGLLLAASGAGSVAGAATSGWWALRLGHVRALLVLFWSSQPFLFLIPLTGNGGSVVLYPLGTVVATYGLAAYNVLQTTFRQLVCPPHLYGRMTATSRFLGWGGIPVGAALGGLLGELAGVRPVLWVAATGASLSGVWLVASPLLRPSRAPGTNLRGQHG